MFTLRLALVLYAKFGDILSINVFLIHKRKEGQCVEGSKWRLEQGSCHKNKGSCRPVLSFSSPVLLLSPPQFCDSRQFHCACVCLFPPCGGVCACVLVCVPSSQSASVVEGLLFPPFLLLLSLCVCVTCAYYIHVCVMCQCSTFLSLGVHSLAGAAALTEQHGKTHTHTMCVCMHVHVVHVCM